MGTTIAASLTLDSQQAETSVKSFKAQLREATNELISIQQKFGETSTEAIAAAKNVAGLKASIKDAKEVADLFNPETKFQAFGNAVRASVGGITALTGAMALFGSESKQVQEALLKVQGALALTEGVNTLADAAKDFTRLKTVAVDAFNSIKVAIGSSGIGAIVIAIGLLITYWDDIKVAIGGATAQQIKNLEESKKSLDIEKQKLDIITSQQNIYKQQGLSQQQILDIENKQLQVTILAAQKALDAQKIISKQAIDATASVAALSLRGSNLGFVANLIFGKPGEVIDTANKTLLEAQAGLDKLKDQLAANQISIIASTVAFNQKLTDLNHAAQQAGITDQYLLSQLRLKDTLEQQKQQITLEYTNLVQRNELLKATQAKYDAESAALAKANKRKLNDDLRKLDFDAYTANLQGQNIFQELQLKFQLDSDIKQTTLEISNLKDRNEKIAAIQATYDAKLSALRLKNLQDFQNKYRDSITAQQVAQEQRDEDAFKKTEAENDEIRKKKIDGEQAYLDISKEIGDMHLDQAGQQAEAELAQLDEWLSRKLEQAKGNADAELAIHKEYERQKTEITDRENQARLSIISGVLGQAATLFGQASAAGKVLAIAQATIDTYQSAVASYKSLAGIPIVGPALGFAAAGVAIAAGLANVKKIVSVQVPGSSSASSSVGSISTSAPLQVTPQVGSTQLPQQQINQIGNASDPIRAFVLESDNSNATERITRLNRAARLGG